MAKTKKKNPKLIDIRWAFLLFVLAFGGFGSLLWLPAGELRSEMQVVIDPNNPDGPNRIFFVCEDSTLGPHFCHGTSREERSESELVILGRVPSDEVEHRVEIAITEGSRPTSMRLVERPRGILDRQEIEGEAEVQEAFEQVRVLGNACALGIPCWFSWRLHAGATASFGDTLCSDARICRTTLQNPDQLLHGTMTFEGDATAHEVRLRLPVSLAAAPAAIESLEPFRLKIDAAHANPVYLDAFADGKWVWSESFASPTIFERRNGMPRFDSVQVSQSLLFGEALLFQTSFERANAVSDDLIYALPTPISSRPDLQKRLQREQRMQRNVGLCGLMATLFLGFASLVVRLRSQRKSSGESMPEELSRSQSQSSRFATAIFFALFACVLIAVWALLVLRGNLPQTGLS